MRTDIPLGAEAEKQREKAEPKSYSVGDTSAQASRQLGGDYAGELRRKLWLRRERIHAELREIDLALTLINNDPEVGSRSHLRGEQDLTTLPLSD